MHDFIRLQSFSPSRHSLGLRPAAADWIQRGIMRSFGEDDVGAAYRVSPKLAVRLNPKSKIQNRK